MAADGWARAVSGGASDAERVGALGCARKAGHAGARALAGLRAG